MADAACLEKPAAAPEPPPPPPPSPRVFLRLLMLLRPYWGRIALGVLLLLLATPCELFPGIVWRYVTDDVVLQKGTTPSLTRLFSFGGTIDGRFGLLMSS